MDAIPGRDQSIRYFSSLTTKLYLSTFLSVTVLETRALLYFCTCIVEKKRQTSQTGKQAVLYPTSPAIQIVASEIGKI